MWMLAFLGAIGGFVAGFCLGVRFERWQCVEPVPGTPKALREALEIVAKLEREQAL